MTVQPNPCQCTTQPLAIVGMGCLLPRAQSIERFWNNIRHGRDALQDVPESHWRIADYYDPDPQKRDHT